VLALLFSALFIAMNGFFVAAEFALVKVGTTRRLTSRAKKGDARAAFAQKVASRLERYLSVTQFCITLASLGLGWLGEPAIEARVDGAWEAISGRNPPPAFHVAAIALAFGALTFAHVLFGELVPKLIAIQRSEKTAIVVASPLHFVYVVFRPVLWVLERMTALVLRAMGMSADAATEGRLSEEEILGILAASTARSPGGKEKAELVERVVSFSQRTARQVMVPRVDVASLPITTTGKEARAMIQNNQYTRIILTKERELDEVVGYLYAKDLLLDPNAESLPSLHPIKRTVLFVPETQDLVQVLRSMQKSHTQIGVVVDEYGGTSGIVTMEDLLEEIVGEIRDEFDEEPQRVVKAPNEADAWDVDARAQMEELRPTGLTVTSDEQAETVGAVVLSRLGRLPKHGDRVDLTADSTAEITGLSRRRVTHVRVRKVASA
jgi:CBS domain containing-hemolysin-like protein